MMENTVTMIGEEKIVRLPLPTPVSDLLSLPTITRDTTSLQSQTLSDVPSDIIIRSRIKYGRHWSACKGLLMEYSKCSSIHGIRFLFEAHRPFYEKFYWGVLLLTSFYFATSLSWDSYLKWQDSPVILGFAETLVPVHKIAFPTITVCPEIKMDPNKFDFTEVAQQMWKEIEEFKTFDIYGNLTEEQISHLSATMHICDEVVVQRFAPFIPKDVVTKVAQTLVDLSLSKDETASFCKWNGRFYFCDKILNLVATDEGICYQFNGLQTKDLYRDPKFVSYYDEVVADFNKYWDDLPLLNNLTGNWSLDYGYVGQGYNAYPQRTVFSSVRNAFIAALEGFRPDFDYACRSFKQGYKVFLNSPESVPLSTGNYILVPHGYEVMISVLPHYIVSDDNLHNFSPDKRQCYFNDERYLRFFRAYSQANCQTECLANYTISKCGCAKFWMPKPLYVPECGVFDINCYTEAQKELHLLLQKQTTQKILDAKVEIMCDCMPACTSLEYNVEISRSRYDINKMFEAVREVYDEPDLMVSRLVIYFKEHQFTAIKRTVLSVTMLFGVTTFVSVTTLIANCGGIFGLFMGISSLSVMELFYFFSVRLVANIRRRRIVQKKELQEESEHTNN